MKRSPELAVLSREHHLALELALRLRRAGPDADAPALAAAAAEFWRVEGAGHFRLEEELLLPAFARHVAADDPDIVRALTEHVDIRRRIGDLERGAGVDAQALVALGEALGAHVRFEERTLFERIEAALDAGELAALGDALDRAGHARPGGPVT